METVDTAATSPAALADAMVGRRVSLTRGASPGRLRGRRGLRSANLTCLGAGGVKLVDDVSFTLRAG